jgi:hypothetical protein
MTRLTTSMMKTLNFKPKTQNSTQKDGLFENYNYNSLYI